MIMFPNPGTPFEHISEPSAERVAAIRQEAEQFIPQMKHCTRCRADAVGLLDKDQSAEFRGCLSACAHTQEIVVDNRPFVAVATLEGVLGQSASGRGDPLSCVGRDAGRLQAHRHAARAGIWCGNKPVVDPCRDAARLSRGPCQRHWRNPETNPRRKQHPARGDERIHPDRTGRDLPGKGRYHVKRASRRLRKSRGLLRTGRRLRISIDPRLVHENELPEAGPFLKGSHPSDFHALWGMPEESNGQNSRQPV